MRPSPQHQAVIDRFIAACQADERVVAAFLGGSYARGAADAYSDLDLDLITTDDAHDDFVAGREAFMRRLGEPVFLEDFDIPDTVFYIFADGAEGELGLGRESQVQHIHSGLYQVLLDKKGILTDAVFPGHAPAQAAQTEKLRRQIYWFWHDLSHSCLASNLRPRYRPPIDGPLCCAAPNCSRERLSRIDRPWGAKSSACSPSIAPTPKSPDSLC